MDSTAGAAAMATMVNLTNLQPIFTQDQLTVSLCATYLATPIIQHAVLMEAHLPNPTTPNWTVDESRLLHQYDCIYVPDIADL